MPLSLAIGLGLTYGQGGVSLFSQVQGMFQDGAVDGALFDISQLNTLFADRSATPSTPASVDGVVGTILDLSGNANHAIAASDAARGILRQTVDGYRYIDVDGVDDFYQLLGSATTLDLGNTWSHVGAWQSDETIRSPFATSNQNMAPLTVGEDLRWYTSITVVSPLIDTSVNINAPSVWSIIQTDADNIIGYGNGVEDLTINPYDGSTPSKGLALFSRLNNASNLSFQGRFYRGLWIKTILTTTERQLCEAWAAAAHGVSL